MQFIQDRGALLARRGGETLRIEPWGPDSLRIRAWMYDSRSGADWALTETPAPAETRIHIGEEEERQGDGTFTKVPFASVENGRIRVDEDLLYYTESGYETIVKMGERIGKSKKLSKGTGPAD